MRAGIAFLIVAYMLSQFYRAFLAVLSPVLMAEVGASTADLARASGLWFAAFALMQLPVGWALDHLGPRRTASVLFLIGGAGGAAVFATAEGPGAITAAMVLIGIGCAPVLMATYYIFARQFAPAIFGTLAGVTVGVSSLGNILSAAPLAWLIEAFGWRATVGSFAVLTAGIALAIALLVRDPEKPAGEAKGSLLDLLRMPALYHANGRPAGGAIGEENMSKQSRFPLTVGVRLHWVSKSIRMLWSSCRPTHRCRQEVTPVFRQNLMKADLRCNDLR